MRRETYGSIAAGDPAENNSSMFTSKDARKDNGSETRYAPKVESPLLDEIIIMEDEDDAFLAGKYVNLEQHRAEMKVWEIGALLSTAFAYGCVMTTLFLLTLPLECERIQMEHPAVSKSISLAIFVAIAGMTQLIAPLVGMLSDTYQPPILEGEEDQPVRMGIRLPYLVLGTILTVTGLLGQSLFSYEAIWFKYSGAFFMHMIGLNMIYSIMIALIPDFVPSHQTGIANGTMALLMVTGSLFGFVCFHSPLIYQSVANMYRLYVIIVIGTSILTCFVANERDVQKAQYAQQRRLKRSTATPIHNHHDDTHDDDKNTEPNSQIQSTGVTENSSPTGKKPLRPFPVILLLRTMIYDPIKAMEYETFTAAYTVDSKTHHDFFVVTISRTFYYMGISVQTFFLYFVHDVIHVYDHPEAAVAILAIVGQCAGAVTCYPVGWLSDQYMGGRRKPFVYMACAILIAGNLGMLWCTTLHQMMIVCTFLGAANGMYLTMDTSLAVDTLPDHNKTTNNNSNHNMDNDEEGEEGSAQLLGLWGVAGFVGSALGPLLGGPLLHVFGSTSEITSPNNATAEDHAEYSIRGYCVVLSMSAFYFALSAIILCFVRRPGV